VILAEIQTFNPEKSGFRLTSCRNNAAGVAFSAIFRG